jgi:hypothetical protein
MGYCHKYLPAVTSSVAEDDGEARSAVDEAHWSLPAPSERY